MNICIIKMICLEQSATFHQRTLLGLLLCTKTSGSCQSCHSGHGRKSSLPSKACWKWSSKLLSLKLSQTDKLPSSDVSSVFVLLLFMIHFFFNVSLERSRLKVLLLSRRNLDQQRHEYINRFLKFLRPSYLILMRFWRPIPLPPPTHRHYP